MPFLAYLSLLWSEHLIAAATPQYRVYNRVETEVNWTNVTNNSPKSTDRMDWDTPA